MAGFRFTMDWLLLCSSSSSSSKTSSTDRLLRFACDTFSNLSNLQICRELKISGIWKMSILFKKILLSTSSFLVGVSTSIMIASAVCSFSSTSSSLCPFRLLLFLSFFFNSGELGSWYSKRMTSSSLNSSAFEELGRSKFSEEELSEEVSSEPKLAESLLRAVFLADRTERILDHVRVWGLKCDCPLSETRQKLQHPTDILAFCGKNTGFDGQRGHIWSHIHPPTPIPPKHSHPLSQNTHKLIYQFVNFMMHLTN